MNWSGQQAGEGFEYHILAIALCIPLLISGGGRFSADGFIAKRFSTLMDG
jgi:putative oxidoreductase